MAPGARQRFITHNKAIDLVLMSQVPGILLADMTDEKADSEKVQRPTAAEILRRVLEKECGDLPSDVKVALLGLATQPASRPSRIKDLIKRAVDG